MAQENATKFIELLAGNEELQKKLQEAAAAYDGPKEDKALFEAVIAPIAEEAGLPFDFEEGFAAAAAERDLSDEELEAVAGGSGAGGAGCWLIGVAAGGYSGPGEDDWFHLCYYGGLTWAS